MIIIPELTLKQLDKIFFDYLWDNKPAKITRRKTSKAGIYGIYELKFELIFTMKLIVLLRSICVICQ